MRKLFFIVNKIVLNVLETLENAEAKRFKRFSKNMEDSF